MSGLTSNELKNLYEIMERELAPFEGVVSSFVSNQNLLHRNELRSFVQLMPTNVPRAFQQLIQIYSPEEQKQEPPPPPPPPRALKPEEDPRYAPYFKQKKMGVPIDSIKFQMQAVGLDPSVIETPQEAAAREEQEKKEKAESEAREQARAKAKAEAESKAKAEAEAKAREEEEAKRTVEVITQELQDLQTQKQKKIDEAYNNILKPWVTDIEQINTIISSVGDIQLKANELQEKIDQIQSQINMKSRKLRYDSTNQNLITEIKKSEEEISNLENTKLYLFNDDDMNTIRDIVNNRGFANFNESFRNVTLTNYQQLLEFWQQLDTNQNFLNARNIYETREAEIEAQDNPGIGKLQAELQAKKAQEAAAQQKTPAALRKKVPPADPVAEARKLAEEAEQLKQDSDDDWSDGGGWLPREQYITLFW